MWHLQRAAEPFWSKFMKTLYNALPATTLRTRHRPMCRYVLEVPSEWLTSTDRPHRVCRRLPKSTLAVVLWKRELPYSWQIIKAARHWNISPSAQYSLTPTPILMWGCGAGWLRYFHILPMSLKALGFLRLCRGTVWRKSTFSAKGGKNEETVCAFISGQSTLPAPQPHPTPLLHTYVIWRIARWHYPV